MLFYYGKDITRDLNSDPTLGMTPRLFLCLVEGLPSDSAFAACVAYKDPAEALGWGIDRMLLVEHLETTKALLKAKIEKQSMRNKIKATKTPAIKKKPISTENGAQASQLQVIAGSFGAMLPKQ